MNYWAKFASPIRKWKWSGNTVTLWQIESSGHSLLRHERIHEYRFAWKRCNCIQCSKLSTPMVKFTLLTIFFFSFIYLFIYFIYFILFYFFFSIVFAINFQIAIENQNEYFQSTCRIYQGLPTSPNPFNVFHHSSLSVVALSKFSWCIPPTNLSRWI